MIAEEHIACFGWASNEEMQDISSMAIRVNDFLCGMFAAINIRLVDFKLEFGRIWDGDYSRVILADEISPDGCRLWDMTTGEKLDKDRFRRDLGGEDRKPIRKSPAGSACSDDGGPSEVFDLGFCLAGSRPNRLRGCFDKLSMSGVMEPPSPAHPELVEGSRTTSAWIVKTLSIARQHPHTIPVPGNQCLFLNATPALQFALRRKSFIASAEHFGPCQHNRTSLCCVALHQPRLMLRETDFQIVRMACVV
jgi:hypothetical protein